MPMPAQALIRVTGLAGQRGERSLFSGLDLALAPGDVVWLRGRNGCGKTSLLRLLAGLATPQAGAVARNSPLAYIGHANALKDDLTAVEALAFLARLTGPVPGGAALSQALARLGVAGCARRPVRTLSQGQRRRVALARLALPQAPRLWLLDEPFDALDDHGVAALNALLAAHSGQGGAALLTSHQALTLDGTVLRELWLDGRAAAASAPAALPRSVIPASDGPRKAAPLGPQ